MRKNFIKTFIEKLIKKKNDILKNLENAVRFLYTLRFYFIFHDLTYKTRYFYSFHKIFMNCLKSLGII